LIYSEKTRSTAEKQLRCLGHSRFEKKEISVGESKKGIKGVNFQFREKEEIG